jgi:hypothetical protein
MSAPGNPSGGNAPQSFSFQKALLISRPSGLIHPNLLHLELETAESEYRFNHRDKDLCQTLLKVLRSHPI